MTIDPETGRIVLDHDLNYGDGSSRPSTDDSTYTRETGGASTQSQTTSSNTTSNNSHANSTGSADDSVRDFLSFIPRFEVSTARTVYVLAAIVVFFIACFNHDLVYSIFYVALPSAVLLYFCEDSVRQPVVAVIWAIIGVIFMLFSFNIWGVLLALAGVLLARSEF